MSFMNGVQEWFNRAARFQQWADDHGFGRPQTQGAQGDLVRSRFGGYGRYDDDPSKVGCPRAKTDMTPCVARDGTTALYGTYDTEQSVEGVACVGCDLDPATLLKHLVWDVTEPPPQGTEAQTLFAWALRDMAEAVEDQHSVGLDADRRTKWRMNLVAAANLVESQAARVIELEAVRDDEVKTLRTLADNAHAVFVEPSNPDYDDRVAEWEASYQRIAELWPHG